MRHSLTIYCGVSFEPYEDTDYSSYTSYVASLSRLSETYVLLSLQLFSYFPRCNFVVVTNDPYLYLTIANNHSIAMPQIQYCPFEFRTDVGTPFRLAHYKIDVWNHISTYCSTSHALLLDLDVVAFPNTFNQLLGLLDDQTDIYFYDQYDIQIRSYSEKVVKSDIGLLYPSNDSNLWAGGEFLLAKTSSFAYIYGLACDLYVRYLESLPKLRHIGDEVLLTAALISSSHKLCIKSINQYPILNRLFLARLLKGARRQSLHDIFGYSLLHLPSSKSFLSSFPFRQSPLIIRYSLLYLYMIVCIILLRFLPCR